MGEHAREHDPDDEPQDEERASRRKRERHEGYRHNHWHLAHDTAYWKALPNEEVVSEWVKHIRGKSSRLAERTRDRYVLSVEEFTTWIAGRTHLTDVKREVIKRYLDYLEHDRIIELPKGSHDWYKAQLGGSSRKNQLAALRHFFRFLMYVDEERNYDPTAAIERPSVPLADRDSLKADEQRDILYWRHKDRRYRRERFVVWFLLHTGCRVDELRHLTRDNVDIDSRSIYVVGKGDRVRTVPMASELVPEILSWFDAQDREAASHPKMAETLNGSTPWLLTTTAGTQMTAKAIWLTVKKRAARAGVRPAEVFHYEGKDRKRLTENVSKVTPHLLRKTLATNLLENGARLDEVADILGHRDVQTTRLHYLNPSDDRLKTAIRRLKFG